MIYDVNWSAEPPPKVTVVRIKMGYEVSWASGLPSVKMSRDATQEDLPYSWNCDCVTHCLPSTWSGSTGAKTVYASKEMSESEISERYYNMRAAPKPKKDCGYGGGGRFYEKFVRRTARRGRNFI